MAEVHIKRIVVASPGDVQAERNALPAVVEELNNGIARDRGIRLELAPWETDAYPGFHPEGPQGLIDAILRIEDCDVLIGIFWKRFGTPVKDAKSGTEHDFRRAYEAWQQHRRPHIMVYFNQRAYSPRTKEETDQWGEVLEFRRHFPKEGLWWPYRGKAQFEGLVRNHLTQVLRQHTAQPAQKQMPLGPATPDQLQPLRERGLNATDIALFRDAYAKMLEADRGDCSYEEVIQAGNSIGLDEPGVIEATQMLKGLRLWDASGIVGTAYYSHVEATTPGMEQYCKAFLSDYHALTTDVKKRIISGVTSSGEISSDELASAVRRPKVVIVHILRLLQENDYIGIDDSGGTVVDEVKPKLKRWFEQS
jgi:hypothetical protein